MNYRISRNLEYALMALGYMSERKNQCVSAKEMVQAFNCPFHPFSRVLQKLADHELVLSRKGLGGGYVFTKDLDELSLYKLMSILLKLRPVCLDIVIFWKIAISEAPFII